MDNNNEIAVLKDRLQAILKKLNWTEAGVLHSHNKVARVKETESSFWQYEEPNLPENFENGNSVTLDKKELQDLLNNPTAKVPEKFSDLQTNFSREEKLIIYEHTVNQKKDLHFPIVTDDRILAEIVAMKKQEKKRRRKYRISKPTHTEEIRSVVELQMRALQEFFQSQEKIVTSRENAKRESSSVDWPRSNRSERLGNHASPKTNENDKFDKEAGNMKRGSHQKMMKRDFTDHKSRRKDKRRSRSRSRHRASRHNPSTYESRSRK